jgi:hypothetical protein
MDWREILPPSGGALVQSVITLLQPDSGTPGTLVQVSGRPFSGGAVAQAWWIHTDGSAEVLGEDRVIEDGTCQLSFEVPATTPGYHMVAVGDGHFVAFAGFRSLAEPLGVSERRP